jgi:hypothetical protein
MGDGSTLGDTVDGAKLGSGDGTWLVGTKVGARVGVSVGGLVVLPARIAQKTMHKRKKIRGIIEWMERFSFFSYFNFVFHRKLNRNFEIPKFRILKCGLPIPKYCLRDNGRVLFR